MFEPRLLARSLACIVIVAVGGCEHRLARSSRSFSLPVGLLHEAQLLGLSAEAPKAILDACARLSVLSETEKVNRRVICPPLVPRGALSHPPLLQGEGEVTTEDLRYGYGAQLSSVELPGANGGHWNFAAGTPQALRQNIFPPPPLTPPGNRPAPAVHPVTAEPITLAGQKALMYLMPPYSAGGGIDASHIVIAWQQGREAYQLSVHGSHNALRARLMATAWILKIRA